MPARQPNLFTRHDTFFGVCQAIGDDFGFNPNYLRVLFGVAILWNPTAVFVTYLALGVVAMVSRWLFPTRPATRPAKAAPVLVTAATAQPGAPIVQEDAVFAKAA